MQPNRIRTRPAQLRPQIRGAIAWPYSRGRPSFGLLDGDDAVRSLIGERLRAFARPSHGDLIDRSCRAKPEVQPPIVLRKVTALGNALGGLALAGGDNFNAGANAVAIAFCGWAWRCSAIA